MSKENYSDLSQTIIRVERSKDNPWVTMHRQFIDNEEMSLKAKGLMVTLLSKPDNWQIYVRELASHLKENKDTVAAIMNELINFGYVCRRRRLREDKTFAGYDYQVFERVEDNPVYQGEKPCPKKPDTEKPDPETSELLTNDLTENLLDEFDTNVRDFSDSGKEEPDIPSPGDYTKDFEEIEDSGKLKSDRFRLSQDNERIYKELSAKHGRERVKGVCIQYLADRKTPAGDLDHLFKDSCKWFYGIFDKLGQSQETKTVLSDHVVKEIQEHDSIALAEHDEGETILKESGGLMGMMLGNLGKKRETPPAESAPRVREPNRATDLIHDLAAAKKISREQVPLEIY